MIEPCQMQNPVQSQYFNFFTDGVSEAGGATGRHIGGDGNIAQESLVPVEIHGWRRERKHVRRFVLSSKLAI